MYEDDLVRDIKEVISREYLYEVNDVFIDYCELHTEDGDDFEVKFSFTSYGHGLVENCYAIVGANVRVVI